MKHTSDNQAIPERERPAPQSKMPFSWYWLSICLWVVLSVLPLLPYKLTNPLLDWWKVQFCLLVPTIIFWQTLLNRSLPKWAMTAILVLDAPVVLVTCIIALFHLIPPNDSICNTIPVGNYVLEDHSHFVFSQEPNHSLVLTRSVFPGIVYYKVLGSCAQGSLDVKVIDNHTIEFGQRSFWKDPVRRERADLEP